MQRIYAFGMFDPQQGTVPRPCKAQGTSERESLKGDRRHRLRRRAVKQSPHDRTKLSFMSLRQLWMSMYDMSGIEPLTISSCVGGSDEVPLLTEG